ncbi:MAG TPA: hypothetical protein DEA22_07180, partial [Blastocatellia bacterium]|nr:hypothetical protein [Blastocatellia bacterium]
MDAQQELFFAAAAHVTVPLIRTTTTQSLCQQKTEVLQVILLQIKSLRIASGDERREKYRISGDTKN